jgi:hypothetical protein
VRRYSPKIHGRGSPVFTILSGRQKAQKYARRSSLFRNPRAGGFKQSGRATVLLRARVLAPHPAFGHALSASGARVEIVTVVQETVAAGAACLHLAKEVSMRWGCWRAGPSPTRRVGVPRGGERSNRVGGTHPRGEIAIADPHRFYDHCDAQPVVFKSALNASRYRRDCILPVSIA